VSTLSCMALYEAPIDRLYATEAVCRRLFLWLRWCWHGGSYEAASEQGCKRATMLDDFSAGGLSMRLPWRVTVGVKLCTVVRLTTDPFAWAAALCVVMRGLVRRVEPQPDGTYGVGVACTHHRSL